MGSRGPAPAPTAMKLRRGEQHRDRLKVRAPLPRRTAPVLRGARHGDIVRNPLVPIVRDAADQVRLLGRELGLSPSARAGLQMEMSARSSLFDEMDALIGPSPRVLVLQAAASGDD